MSWAGAIAIDASLVGGQLWCVRLCSSVLIVKEHGADHFEALWRLCFFSADNVGENALRRMIATQCGHVKKKCSIF